MPTDVTYISEREREILSEIERVFRKLNPEVKDVRVEFRRRTKIYLDWYAQFLVFSDGVCNHYCQMYWGYYNSLCKVPDAEIKIRTQFFTPITSK